MKRFYKLTALAVLLALVFTLSGCSWFGMSRTLTQEEIDAIEVGTVTDGVYHNETFDLTFAVPEGWTVSTQDEILSFNKWKADKDKKEQALDSLGKPGYFYEMSVSRDDGKAAVTVCVENASILEQPDITEDMYAASALLNAQEHFKEAGCLNVEIEKICESFAGEDHYGYYATCTSPTGTLLYYKAIYVKEGIYAAVITATSAEEDLTGEALAVFE
ncbi:MAG: hypothetical protein J6J43_09685 [Oscillospiraceae bacterium]|nr:hypothetical protein [Oscillospiraceae bacterium]